MLVTTWSRLGYERPFQKQLFVCILSSDELAMEKRDMHRISWLPGTFLVEGVTVLEKSGELGPRAVRCWADCILCHVRHVHASGRWLFLHVVVSNLGLHRTIAVEKES